MKETTGKIFLITLIFFLNCGFVVSVHAEQTWEEKWSQDPYITEVVEMTKKIRLDYSVESRVHTRIKIQKEEAKNLGQIPINYDASLQEIKDIDAFVITPEGQKLKYKEIYDMPVYGNFSIYSNVRMKNIIMPEVNIGSVIDYSYTAISHPIIEEGFWDTIYEYNSSPTKFCRYKIITPKPLKFKILYYNNPARPKTEETEDERIYTWEASNLDRTKIEEYMPPNCEVFPWTGITTLDSWKIINDWYGKKFSQNTHADAEIRNKVKDLVGNETDELKKVEKIFQYLQDSFRYVSLSGFYTFGPHPAGDIFKNKYGDCEDQSCLLITMLKECGIKAMPALYHDASEGKIYNELPMLNFGHVIVAAKINDKLYFIDPLIKGYHIDEVPYSMQGAHLFVVDGNGGFIHTLPILDETSNLKITKIKFKIMPDGSATKEEDDIVSRPDSISYKQSYIAMGEREKEDYLAEIESTETSGGKLISFDWADIDNLYTPLKMKLKFEIPEWASLQGEYMICQPFTPSRLNMFTSKTRQFPIMFFANSRSDWQVVYEASENFEIICLPEDFHFNTPLAECDSKFRVEENKIYYDYIFRYKRGLLPVSDYQILKNFYDKLSKAMKQYIILKNKNPVNQ